MTLSDAFTGLSGLLWLASAFVPLPATVWLVSGVGGGRPSPELDKVLVRLRWQSRCNAAAAFCLFVSLWLKISGH